jgi:hypothetical protein
MEKGRKKGGRWLRREGGRGEIVERGDGKWQIV